MTHLTKLESHRCRKEEVRVNIARGRPEETVDVLRSQPLPHWITQSQREDQLLQRARGSATVEYWNTEAAAKRHQLVKSSSNDTSAEAPLQLQCRPSATTGKQRERTSSGQVLEHKQSLTTVDSST